MDRTPQRNNMGGKAAPIIESAAQSIYSSVKEPWVFELCQKSQEEINGDLHRRERLAEQDNCISALEDFIRSNNLEVPE